MNNFSDKVCIAIDFETSHYATNSACSVGLAKIYNNEVIDTYYTLIKPPSSQVYFTRVHGFTWNMLVNQQTFSEKWNEIADFIVDASAFVAHNAGFDKRVLQGTCLHYAITPPDLPFYCTLKAARKYFNMKPNNLQNICNNLNIELTHHNALSDAMAAAKIFLYCLEQNYDLTKCC